MEEKVMSFGEIFKGRLSNQSPFKEAKLSKKEREFIDANSEIILHKKGANQWSRSFANADPITRIKMMSNIGIAEKAKEKAEKEGVMAEAALSHELEGSDATQYETFTFPASPKMFPAIKISGSFVFEENDIVHDCWSSEDETGTPAQQLESAEKHFYEEFLKSLKSLLPLAISAELDLSDTMKTKLSINAQFSKLVGMEFNAEEMAKKYESKPNSSKIEIPLTYEDEALDDDTTFVQDSSNLTALMSDSRILTKILSKPFTLKKGVILVTAEGPQIVSDNLTIGETDPRIFMKLTQIDSAGKVKKVEVHELKKL